MMLSLFLAAHAATLAGVTLPDTASVGGQGVTLNGMGLREKYFIDIYVGGLYLSQKTHDAAAAIDADAPKRVVMHFIYKKVTKDQMVETFAEGFGAQATGAQKPNIDKLVAALPPELVSGQELTFDYTPGKGTTMLLDNKPTVTIPGAEFMKMVWGVWLGPKPPTAAIKAGMLGG